MQETECLATIASYLSAVGEVGVGAQLMLSYRKSGDRESDFWSENQHWRTTNHHQMHSHITSWSSECEKIIYMAVCMRRRFKTATCSSGTAALAKSCNLVLQEQALPCGKLAVVSKFISS